MKTRIYNAKILTFCDVLPTDDNFPIIDGEIHITDNKISNIIKGTHTYPAQAFDNKIDAGGNLVMPGFKNAHAHAPMSFARSFADDLPLDKWLNNKIFPMEAKLSDEHIKLFTKLSFLEYLSSGITSSFEMYFRPENIISAAKDFGFRTVICGALNDFVESIERMAHFYDTLNNDDLISYRLGFHAEYTTNESLLRQISDLCHDKKAPVYCHNSETKSEVAGCIARHGLSPVRYLDSLGLFDYGGGGFHMLYTDDEDLKILKQRGLHIVTNPGSNCKLASGTAPLYKYVDAGLNIAIGTDGPSSNNALDMFREMYLTTACQKLLTWNAAAMSANHVLYMATVGGAKAMQLDDCDTLTIGKKADLIVIDLNQPNMQPINNITKNIVYSGCKSNVILTMVDGKILYQNGKYHVGEDISDIYKEANMMMKYLI